MSLHIDSDLDSSVNDDEVESDKLPISKELAKSLYDKAGTIVPEDEEEITLEKYQHLLKDSVALIIEEVLREHPLSFKLRQFQLVTLHCIGSLKNVILISPTGRSLVLVLVLVGVFLYKSTVQVSRKSLTSL